MELIGGVADMMIHRSGESTDDDARDRAAREPAVVVAVCLVVTTEATMMTQWW